MKCFPNLRSCALIITTILVIGVTGISTAQFSESVGITDLEWNPNYTQIAIGQTDGQVLIQEGNGNLIWRFAADPIRIYSLAWSPDGQQLAVGGQEVGIRIWDVPTQTQLDQTFTAEDTGGALVWSPDGNAILSAGWETVQAWDVHTGSPLAESWKASINDMAWNHDGSILIVAGIGLGRLRIEEQAFQAEYFTEPNPPTFQSVDWNQAGDQVITADGALGTVSLWDVQTGRVVHTLLETDQFIRNAVFVNADQQLVAISFDGGMIYTVDVETGTVQRSTRHDTYLGALAWNPVSSSLAIGGTVVSATNPANASPVGRQSTTLLGFLELLPINLGE
jgi:WD40 repeat protein